MVFFICCIILILFFIFNIPCFLAEGDPENYLTYFKRGTVYFALGKASLAFSDFDKALELKPDFDAVSAKLYDFTNST